MKIGIVRFPGSNCDQDCYRAVDEGIGAEAVYLWHKSHDLEGCRAILLPGGFSYGDHLRAGAIARFSPIMREVIAFARDGGPVLGIETTRCASAPTPSGCGSIGPTPPSRRSTMRETYSGCRSRTARASTSPISR